MEFITPKKSPAPQACPDAPTRRGVNRLDFDEAIESMDVRDPFSTPTKSPGKPLSETGDNKPPDAPRKKRTTEEALPEGPLLIL